MSDKPTAPNLKLSKEKTVKVVEDPVVSKALRRFVIAIGMIVGGFVCDAAQAQEFSYWGLKSAEYQSIFDALTAQGCRPTLVRIYSQNEEARYDLTMARVPGGAWVARHGLNQPQFDQAHQNFVSVGYRLDLHSVARIGGRLIHVAVWVRD
jgi:hypothetical protein